MLRHRTEKFLIAALVMVLITIITIIYPKSTLKGWSIETSRDTALYTYPNRSTVIIKPKDLCQSPVYLMITVCSSPSHFEERIAIRESWGIFKNVRTSIKVYFLLGITDDMDVQKSIYDENEMYDDIVQESFVDTYYNLTIKSLMLLKLFKFECKEKVKFVMKVDDDTFVNVYNLLTFLKDVKKNSTIFGKLMSNYAPVRDYYDKWYVPMYMYNSLIYPNFISGSSYVMTTDTAVKLFKAALTIPIFHLEDVYITGICAKAVDIIPEMNTQFFNVKVEFNPCTYKNLISSHYISPIEMRFLYYRVNKLNYTNLVNC